MEIEKQDNSSSEEHKDKTEKDEERIKKVIDTPLEKVQIEIDSQIDEIEKRFQRQIDEHYEVIKKELSVITTTATKIEGMENRLQALVEKERGEIKKELSVMTASKQRIENELGDILSDKWDIVIKLRSKTYDKLMKEYKKVEENLILQRTEIPDETIDNEPQEDE
jgi:predicted protein tyrosine phosphatase